MFTDKNWHVLFAVALDFITSSICGAVYTGCQSEDF